MKIFAHSSTLFRRAFVGFFLSATVIACQAEDTQAPSNTTAIPQDADTQACLDAGGTPSSGLAGPVCAMPEEDAGKACNASSECSGFCLADTRTCSPVKPYFGCHKLYENGETPTLCVD